MAQNEVCSEAVTYHGQLARDWEQRYRKPSFRARLIVLDECLRSRKLHGHWLDAGCGSGFLSRWLAEHGCTVLGVDAAPEMVEVSRDLAARHQSSEQLSFRQVETIARLPIEAEKFDGILCSSVLEYLPDPVACLAEFSRVLRPGGLLLVSVPNAASMVRRAQIVCHRVGKGLGRSWVRFLEYSHNQYHVLEFSELLVRAGFSVQGTLAFGSPLPRNIQRRPWAGPLLMFLAEKNVNRSASQ